MNLATSTIEMQGVQPERRHYPRFKVGVPVEFRTETASTASRTQTSDLSQGGCYLEMSFTLQVGTEVDMSLWLDDEKVDAKALVTTHHPLFGNGFTFTRMTTEDQLKLENFLDHQNE